MDANSTLVWLNDHWKSTQRAAIEATGFHPSEDKETAILAGLIPGNNTTIMRGVGDTTGIGLAVAYHLD